MTNENQIRVDTIRTIQQVCRHSIGYDDNGKPYIVPDALLEMLDSRIEILETVEVS